MSTVQITIPEELRAVADEEVASGRYADHSDYIASLIRHDVERREVEAKLLQRLHSGPSREVTSADFDRIRQRLDARRTQGRPQ